MSTLKREQLDELVKVANSWAPRLILDADDEMRGRFYVVNVVKNASEQTGVAGVAKFHGTVDACGTWLLGYIGCAQRVRGLQHEPATDAEAKAFIKRQRGLRAKATERNPTKRPRKKRAKKARKRKGRK